MFRYSIQNPQTRDEYILAALQRSGPYTWRFSQDHSLDLEDVRQQAALVITETIDRALTVCGGKSENLAALFAYLNKAVRCRLISSITRCHSIQDQVSYDKTPELIEYLSEKAIHPDQVQLATTRATRREQALYAALATLPLDEQTSINTVAKIACFTPHGATPARTRNALVVRRAAYRHLKQNRELVAVVIGQGQHEGRELAHAAN